MSAKRKPRAIYLVLPEVQLLDLSGVAYAFARAGLYGQPYEVVFCSSEEEVDTIGGLKLSNFVNYASIDIQKSDTLFIPGFEGKAILSNEFRKRSRSLYDWLRQAVQRGALVCSVCSGSYLLAQAGLLDGRECATHWTCVDHLQRRFPNLKVVKNRLFVRSSENIYTSAGVTSGIDLALHILSRRHGAKLAFQVARRLVVYYRRNGADEQESIYLKYRNHVDDTIHKVQDWLVQHLDQSATIEDLAEYANASPRSLIRNFKKRTGLTIGQYVAELRLELAQTLLRDTGCKVDHVAAECGFSSARQLRNLFRKKLGVSPRKAVAA